jgi:hypothetical protein
VKYQSHGGGHELRNLVTVCDLHHRAIHFGKLVVDGAVGDELSFEFRRPRDRRNVIDDDPPGPRAHVDAETLGAGEPKAGNGSPGSRGVIREPSARPGNSHHHIDPRPVVKIGTSVDS